jgi:hypothetical protein
LGVDVTGDGSMPNKSRRAVLSALACALLLTAVSLRTSVAGSEKAAFTKSCQLGEFTDRAQKSGWLVQELTDEERANFLNHLNRDDGVNANFYPPHLWETVWKKNDLIHIRIVFLDERNCVLGNSGEIGFNELSYLLAPNEGF